MDSYLSFTKLSMLLRYRPTTKVVLIVRNPIDAFEAGLERLLLSGFVRCTHDDCDLFGDGLKDQLELFRFGQRINDLLHYIPRSNVYLVALENLVENPFRELDSLFRFLGIGGQITEKFVHANKNTRKGELLKFDLCRNSSLLSAVVSALIDTSAYQQLLQELAKDARFIPSSYVVNRPDRCRTETEN